MQDVIRRLAVHEIQHAKPALVLNLVLRHG